MKAGLFLLCLYIGYNVAAYGAPEFKVMAIVAVALYACMGAHFQATKNKAKVSRFKTDR